MIDEGYAATQILTQVHDVIIEEKLSDKQKSVIAEKMAVRANMSIKQRLLKGGVSDISCNQQGKQ